MMKEIDQVVRATLDLLAPLLGVWIGRGKGGYPTLDDFEYSETLRVHQVPERSFLSYGQNTELIDLEGRPIRRSHWESGILRPAEYKPGRRAQVWTRSRKVVQDQSVFSK